MRPRKTKPDNGFTVKKLSRPSRVKKRLRIVAGFFLFCSLLVVISFAFIWFYENKYQSKVYPEVFLGAYNLSGLQREETEKIIIDFRRNLETKGLLFRYKDKQTQIFSQVTAADDLDLVYEIVRIDINQTLNNIFNIGRTGSWWTNLRTKIELLRESKKAQLVFQLDEGRLIETLHENFKDLEQPAINAELKIDANLVAYVTPEKTGVVPDYQTALQATRQNLANLVTNEVTIFSIQDEPQLRATDLNAKKSEIEQLLRDRGDLVLDYRRPDNTLKQWSINKNQYKNWLNLYAGKIVFDDDLIDYLRANVATEIEQPVTEARFAIDEQGKVSEFKASQPGVTIDYQNTLANINRDFFAGTGAAALTLLTTEVRPKYTTDAVNDLGIQEIIGIGQSNFSGSPANRRHNISVGAESLNGILIPPGEEFSLAVALGPIDETSRYLPELVIKGNKTIPEYGGGLCQIGTTLFRGALESGLPITERRNHSYRVSYYEPAGTDCTIYPPHPDCRFLNDTGHHLLLQTRIDGNDLFFEFWGTKDGRQVTVGQPIIYNIAPPPPTKYVETEDIPVGQTKCTERAHNGADTKFDYTVVYPDDTKKEETFYSHYRPWQAVCLVGVEKAATGTVGLPDEQPASDVQNQSESTVPATGTSTN